MSAKSSTQPQTSSTESQPNVQGSEASEAEGDKEKTVSESHSQDTETTPGTEAFDITAQTQMQFGSSGELEPKEDAVEVTLDQFDVNIDKREKETQLDRPEASGLMADDRPELDTRDGGTQANLFTDAEEEQQTLTGESAQNQCLFSSESN